MKNHDECKRGFTQLSRAWYADANLIGSGIVDKITVGFYHPEGGTTGEFSISWVRLAGKVIPKLVCYDDGWNALFEFKDMLEFMAGVDDEDISANNFSDALISLGIEDMTKETENGA